MTVLFFKRCAAGPLFAFAAGAVKAVPEQVPQALADQLVAAGAAVYRTIPNQPLHMIEQGEDPAREFRI